MSKIKALPKTEKVHIKKKTERYFDYSLMFIVVFLVCFGLVMVYSTTSYSYGLSYLSSQLPLLKDAGWDLDKQYKTASNVKPQQAGDHMAKALGTVAFTLPYSTEVESLYLAGDLLGELSMKDSRVFRKEIEKISKEVFGC